MKISACIIIVFMHSPLLMKNMQIKRDTAVTQLDLKAVIKNIFRLSDGNSFVNNLNINDTIFTFSPYLPQESLDYAITNLKTGLTKRITGNKTIGYTVEIKAKGSPIIERQDYYPSGSIKIFAKRYVKKSSNPVEINYPVGITKYYDSDGRILKAIDEDDRFKFSYQKIMKYLMKMDCKTIVSSIIGKDDGRSFAFWDVEFRSPSSGLSIIRFDGKSGRILRKSKHVKIIEN